MSLTLEDRIRERAYHISLRDGGAGDDTHYWLIAEREVLAEVALESAPPAEVIEPAEVLEPAEVVESAPALLQPTVSAPVQGAMETIEVSPAAEAAPSLQPAAPAPVQPAKAAARPATGKGKKAARKPAAKNSAKAPGKSAPAESSPLAPSAVVTPITAAKSVKQAVNASAKSRARAAAR